MQISTTGGVYSAFFGAAQLGAAQSSMFAALAQSYGIAGSAPTVAKSAAAQLLDLSAADATGRSNFDVLSAYYGGQYALFD